jgi:hypothetical protein
MIMDFVDTFEKILAFLAKRESLITIELTGRDTGIEGKIDHVGDDYIKIRPEGPATGRIYFIPLSAISYIDTIQPVDSGLNVSLSGDREDDLRGDELKPLKPLL